MGANNGLIGVNNGINQLNSGTKTKVMEETDWVVEVGKKSKENKSLS